MKVMYPSTHGNELVRGIELSRAIDSIFGDSLLVSFSLRFPSDEMELSTLAVPKRFVHLADPTDMSSLS
jgi:hypothetical protein